MIDYTLPLEELPDPLPIEPLAQPFDVTITPPGSKSITNRAYVLAALAEGESRIIRPLRADDTDLLLKALCTLGAEANWVEGQTGDGSEDVVIKGVGGRFPRGGHVNLGDGGTPTRFMIACACLAKEPVVVDGSPRMRERPIAEGVDMLRQLGAKIEYVEEEGRLPVQVTPSDEFKGGEITVGRTQSSQFISAVMLIAPWLSEGVRVRFRDEITSKQYVQLTLRLLNDFHCDTITDEQFFQVVARRPRATTLFIEPDASSATYWFEAVAVVRGSSLRVQGLHCKSAQPDTAVWYRLVRSGLDATNSFDDDSPFLMLAHGSKGLSRFVADAQPFPDGALALAAAAVTANGISTIAGLRTLRVKETDRIAALANELRRVGCVVETTDDSITITPIAQSKNPPAEPGGKQPIIVETYNDHRMAMAFAVLGLRVPGIQIRNPSCVKKSYPTFWRDFQKLYDKPRK